MNVHMKDTLPGGHVYVYTDVVAVGIEFILQFLLLLRH